MQNLKILSPKYDLTIRASSINTRPNIMTIIGATNLEFRITKIPIRTPISLLITSSIGVDIITERLDGMVRLIVPIFGANTVDKGKVGNGRSWTSVGI